MADQTSAGKKPRDLRYVTSESVTEGHPDKVCDAIADAILDEMLRKEKALQERGYVDPDTGAAADVSKARCAIEALVTTGTVVVAGEIRTTAYIDIQDVVRKTIDRIGYTEPELGFAGQSCSVVNLVHGQSPDIAQGVDASDAAKDGSDDPLDAFGAGDQGIMYGYATDETDTFMPMPHAIATALAMRLAAARREGDIAYLKPDGKTQVTVAYDADGRPVAITDVVVSTQHSEDAVQEGADPMGRIRTDVRKKVVEPVLAHFAVPHDGYRLLVNPTGKFVVGGPAGDTGVVGRKIIVDTYGGVGRHGGGCFSGKDFTKVDRTAAYAARWCAKNVVAAGLAKRCELQLSYAIGVASPVSICIDTFGTGVADDREIERAVREVFDFRPMAVIERFGMMDAIYGRYSAYGHFGREGAPWERLDMVEALKTAMASQR